jgi:hypothetical protein
MMLNSHTLSWFLVKQSLLLLLNSNQHIVGTQDLDWKECDIKVKIRDDLNCISNVMVSVIAASVVNCWFELQTIKLVFAVSPLSTKC